MKCLWINNVGNLVGGTLQATLSMVKALPDCEHTVFAFSGEFGPDAIEAFSPKVRLVVGMNLAEFIGNQHWDLCVFQNTPHHRMPNRRPADVLVYYQHSAGSGSQHARERCDLSLCVSKWLADRVGMSHDDVLWQPVHRPDGDGPLLPFEDYFVIGRICTPTRRKWNPDYIIPHLHEIRAWDTHRDLIRYEFVGAPEALKEPIKRATDGRSTFFDASYAARSRFWNWDVLWYDSDLEESYGRTVREAQRCGVVPVVCRRGGFEEQIRHGETGFLFNEVDQFRHWVGLMSRDDVQTNSMSNACVEAGNRDAGLKTWRNAFLKRLGACLK